MGMFGKSKAQIEAEEAEAKAKAEEEARKKKEAKAEEARRLAEETRKQMEAKKASAKSAEDGSFTDSSSPGKKGPKSKVSRAGATNSNDAAALNAQIAEKMAKIKEKEAAKKQAEQEAKEKARQEAIERGEVVPTAGAMKWGSVQAKLGTAALKMKQLQAESRAQQALALKAASGTDEDAVEAQRILAAQQAAKGGGEEEVDPLKAGIGKPLQKPTKAISIAEKNAARSAAALAGGIFLTYDEKIHLDEKVNKLNKKIKDLEDKVAKLKEGDKSGGGGGMMGKVRRMSIGAAAALGGGGSSKKETSKMSKEDQEIAATAAAFAANFAAQAAGNDPLAAAQAHDGPVVPVAAEAPAKPKGKARRLSAIMFGGSALPGKKGGGDAALQA
jgi:hypothetical protein